jgi:small membrane protein
MNLIKILLILSFVALFVWAFRNRSRVGLRAGARLFAVVLTAAAIVSILLPNLLQRLADLVGVTRGTDLLLYGLVVVFVSTTVGSYFRFRDLERRLAELVRADAIRDATLTHGVPGQSKADNGDSRNHRESGAE